MLSMHLLQLLEACVLRQWLVIVDVTWQTAFLYISGFNGLSREVKRRFLVPLMIWRVYKIMLSSFLPSGPALKSLWRVSTTSSGDRMNWNQVKPTAETAIPGRRTVHWMSYAANSKKTEKVKKFSWFLSTEHITVSGVIAETKAKWIDLC